jgi:hypothetical protein
MLLCVCVTGCSVVLWCSWLVPVPAHCEECSLHVPLLHVVNPANHNTSPTPPCGTHAGTIYSGKCAPAGKAGATYCVVQPGSCKSQDPLQGGDKWDLCTAGQASSSTGTECVKSILATGCKGRACGSGCPQHMQQQGVQNMLLCSFEVSAARFSAADHACMLFDTLARQKLSPHPTPPWLAGITQSNGRWSLDRTALQCSDTCLEAMCKVAASTATCSDAELASYVNSALFSAYDTLCEELVPTQFKCSMVSQPTHTQFAMQPVQPVHLPWTGAWYAACWWC